ncbi:MAG TPA: arginine deiminase-related protein [Pirellulales bacterium]|nr:arginine deiminase-related protein [Pirellulales bacterium]
MIPPRILMCQPDFYGIEYEINAWMHRDHPADRPTARAQWISLRRAMEEAGAMVEILPAVAGLPDLVFTANAAIVYHNLAIVAHFRHAERQGEETYDERWLTEHGFRVEHLPPGMYFEGAGDALFCGETLFAGYRLRSEFRAHNWVGQRLGCRVIPLELVDPYYYHLDTCFCPLAPGVAIYYPAAFDNYAATVLRDMVPELIEVSRVEAQRFACNAVVIGRTVITNTGCPELHRALGERGYTPRETPLDEFVKAGGSAKCLTLRLDGEDAASWRNLSAPSAA